MDLNAMCTRAQEGDREAESDLFQYLLVRFRLFANQRIWNEGDVEDVVQDALMKVFAEFRGITFETSFSGWAYKVLDNRILNYIQKKKRRGKTVGDEMEKDREGTMYTPPAIEKETGYQLLECLKKIGRTNRRYARILNLSYQGFNVQEITEKLKITPNNLYVLLSRSRSLLELCLETGGID